MKNYLPMLRNSPFFKGLTDDEILSILHCVNATVISKEKDSYIFRAADSTEVMGLVVSGCVLVVQEDLWGHRNILSKCHVGDFFGEPYAASPGAVLNVSVVADMDCEIIFLNIQRLLATCPTACGHHQKLIRNLVSVLALSLIHISIYRGLGDSKTPMYFIGIACAFNIVLDYVFIGYLHLGASGAALGTTISQTFSVVIALLSIRKKKSGISLRKKHFVPKRQVLGRILKIGVPVAVQDGFIQVAFIIITIIANHRGLNDAAAVGIVEKIITAIFIVPSSMLATISTLSAQNIGANKHDRAAKILRLGTMVTAGYGVLATLIVLCWGNQIIGLFTVDVCVILMGTQYISSYIFDSILAGIHFCFTGYFCAYGKSYIGFIHNILSIAVVRCV